MSPIVLPFTDLSLSGDQLKCKIPGAGAEFAGRLIADSISGTFKVGTQQLTLNLKRGTGADLPTTQLDISPNLLKDLMGRWNGSIGQDTAILRFERSVGGKITVHLDIVNKELKDMLVVKASMTGANLIMKNSDGAEIAVRLKSDKLEGKLKLSQTNFPVALKKQP